MEAWVSESRAIFEADKTGLVHFTSVVIGTARLSQATAKVVPLNFQGKEIKP